MKTNRVFNSQRFIFPLVLSAIFLIPPKISLAGNSKSFVNKIRVSGNTLIDPYLLENYMDLGNGLNMTPKIMDLVASELRANYNFHGYTLVDAYSMLKVKNGVLTIKVDERNEQRWGKHRAEMATLKQAFLHQINLNDSRKQEIIDTLIKGYRKERLIEKLATKFFIKEQRSRIEEILTQRRIALKEKVADKVREFQTTMRNLDEQEAKRIVKMRTRIQLTKLKKTDDSIQENPAMVSEEYSDLEQFLDNVMFEEWLNPGL